MEALLQRVSDDRERRCAALRAASASQAREIVHAAWTEARNNVRNAVTQERARIDLGTKQAMARADIEAHRRERQKSRELLGRMWAMIADTLERRWREPPLRRAWVYAAMSQAAALVPGRGWLIVAGSDWEAQDREEVINHAREQGAGAVEWSLDAATRAGVKIRAGNVCVDATVPGLLTQRDVIEAAFLTEYLPVFSGSEPPSPSGSDKAPGPATERRTDG